jgi:Stf0 sulphotransferase
MNPITELLRRWVGRAPKNHAPDLSRIEPLSDDEAKSIPEADFVSEPFDREASAPPSRMIVILSTPRSGSTFLCQLLHRAGLCTPHEYFQCDHYLPLLAYRWACVDGGCVSWQRYASALERSAWP